jgi:predicted DNA-binding transcriptional regulator YafY
MNRTDRLLAIILQIQAKGCQRAEDLAAHFEVSKRTIYRDIDALYQSGVPLIATPGQGYMLDEGYFLPPLSFTIEEATMLLLGADVMEQSFDAEYSAASKTSSEKILTVLSSELRERADRIRENLIFVTSNNQRPSEILQLRQLRRAIVRQQCIKFRYQSGYVGAPTAERKVDPYRLTHVQGHWYLSGYCHLKRDGRLFRLTRMDDVQILPETFIRREKVLYQIQAQMVDSRTLTVRLLFSPVVAQQIEEDDLFYIEDRQKTDEGISVTLRVRQPHDIVQWVMRWGRHVRVIEPQELRDLVIAEANQILKNHC